MLVTVCRYKLTYYNMQNTSWANNMNKENLTMLTEFWRFQTENNNGFIREKYVYTNYKTAHKMVQYFNYELNLYIVYELFRMKAPLLYYHNFFLESLDFWILPIVRNSK
jgi:hypothetical protein